jgi:hypothetical protein
MAVTGSAEIGVRHLCGTNAVSLLSLGNPLGRAVPVRVQPPAKVAGWVSGRYPNYLRVTLSAAQQWRRARRDRKLLLPIRGYHDPVPPNPGAGERGAAILLSMLNVEISADRVVMQTNLNAITSVCRDSGHHVACS